MSKKSESARLALKGIRRNSGAASFAALEGQLKSEELAVED